MEDATLYLDVIIQTNGSLMMEMELMLLSVRKQLPTTTLNNNNNNFTFIFKTTLLHINFN